MCCCSGTKAKETRVVKDVTCGMQIDPDEAAGQSEYQGQTYCFCAPVCRRKFDANPRQFVK